jgi:hypothetical protein
MGSAKMTDSELRKLAESAGFHGSELWWKMNLPRFEKFIFLIWADTIAGKIDKAKEALEKFNALGVVK